VAPPDYRPRQVAINRVDGAGKTTLTDELLEAVAGGGRAVVGASRSTPSPARRRFSIAAAVRFFGQPRVDDPSRLANTTVSTVTQFPDAAVTGIPYSDGMKVYSIDSASCGPRSVGAPAARPREVWC
jgi:hypothetical protein